MDKIVFADGERIGVIEEGKVRYFECEPILRYKSYLENRKRNNEWKISGEGARFRGDAEEYGSGQSEEVFAYVNGVDWDGDEVVYAYTVNGASGVYKKSLSEKALEAHLYSSQDTEILSVSVFGDLIAVTVRSDDVTSQIGTLHKTTSELRTLTDGDARDADPYFEGGKILFDSAGVGRTANGGFSGVYAPAEILSLDPDTLSIDEVERAGNRSCVHPKRREGALYYIARPNKEKQSGSLFLDIVLFPFRLIRALFGFLQAFTVIFGNTSLTSEKTGGANPTKGRSQSVKQLYVDGKLIEADKEEKRNQKFKDREYGFIPASWELVKKTDKTEVIARGVCDFTLADDGSVYYTDGRHIFRYDGCTTKKIADTERCLTLAVQRTPDREDFLPL